MNEGFLQDTVPPNWAAMTPDRAEADIFSAIDSARRNLDAIKSLSDDSLNYMRVVRALDRAADGLDRAWTYLNHLQSVADEPKLREVLNKLTPTVSDFYSDIYLDESLYAKVKNYSRTAEAKSLTGDRKRMLRETLLDFQLSGADLPADKKARLREIDSLLAVKTQKFSENVLDGTKAYSMNVENEADIAGLPPTAVAIARKKAEAKGMKGWLFTLEQPSYVPFITYADNDALREKLWRESASVAAKGEFSNWGLVREILALRDENAKLLSRDNFADVVLFRRMAKTGAIAEKFVDDLTVRFKETFVSEWNELLEFGRENGWVEGGAAVPWRAAYISEKLRAKKYGFDPELMRPYFPMPEVMKGLFKICETLYGLKISKIDARVPVWHESVETYKISDSRGGTVGLFYADFFPREQKRSGAWMNLLSPADGESPALGVIAGNLTEGVGGAPALLSLDEVETLFHEFGHLIHFFMMDSPEIGLRDVAWDFVELPSQIMENWCHNKKCLDLFARRFDTGEKLPDELFERFDKSKKFMGANASMRQLAFAKIDLEMHIRAARFLSADDMAGEVRKVLEPYTHKYTEPLPPILPRFTHLFGDSVGYAAGYYSYKWAEVLDADAFTRFEREGVLNPDVGREFAEKILRVGNTVDPDEAFRNFMGRDPDVSALVNRCADIKKS